MTSTAIKLLALATMLIDHIGVFIPGAPVQLRWIGRISAPLFLFCSVWGVHYTHNRKAYLLRLYACGCGMVVLDWLCNTLVPNHYETVTNNIFVTILLCAMLCVLGDALRKGEPHAWWYLAGFAVLQVVSFVVCHRVEALGGYEAAEQAGAFLPSLIYCEGGLEIALLGWGLYLLKEKPALLATFYIGFSAWKAWYIADGWGPEYLTFNWGCQWMMVAALPFMLLYNGKKGKGYKWLFYVFYPVHVVVLFLLGNLMYGAL